MHSVRKQGRSWEVIGGYAEMRCIISPRISIGKISSEKLSSRK